jgi:hypothetical protein
MSKEKVAWKKLPEAEDYQGALDFLSLIYPDARADKLLRAFRKAAPIKRAAKDLLRACGLPLLSRDEAHVDEDLKRIHKGKPLAPILLVRGDMSKRHTVDRGRWLSLKWTPFVGPRGLGFKV